MDPEMYHDLKGVWASAPNDVWAVGDLWAAGIVPYHNILHWDGSVWTTYSVDLERGTLILDVWGASPDNIWAVGGRDEDSYRGEPDVILHWDGNTWTKVESVPHGPATFYSVFGSGANDVWVAGKMIYDAVTYEDMNMGILLHWDGNNWTKVQSGCNWPLFGIGGTSNGRYWSVGNYHTILSYP
jgi:hypothetical protein